MTQELFYILLTFLKNILKIFIWLCQVLAAASKILFPQPGTEPESCALQGGFLTTEPPGKSHILFTFNLNSPLRLVATVLDGAEIRGHDIYNSPSNHSEQVAFTYI